MTYRGQVKNGQIMLDAPAELPEGAMVNVEVVDSGKREPTIWEKLLALAGTVQGLPPDMARNHDHYLYGTPKNT